MSKVWKWIILAFSVGICLTAVGAAIYFNNVTAIVITSVLSVAFGVFLIYKRKAL